MPQDQAAAWKRTRAWSASAMLWQWGICSVMCISSGRRRDVMAGERRQEVVKESVSLDVKRAFP
jgi:hypothetical protein